MPVQKTGSEKLSVMVVLPTAPLALTIVGGVVSGVPAVAVCAWGALIALPTRSVMLTLAVVDPAVLSVTSVNAPGGIELARKSVADVTPVSCAGVQVGMLCVLTLMGLQAETFRTVESEGAVVAAGGSQSG